jgi:ABC-type uncharacterized transport system ATPase subunit
MKAREIRTFVRSGNTEEQVVKLLEAHQEEINDLQKVCRELSEMNNILADTMANIVNGASGMRKEIERLSSNKDDDGLGPSTQSIGH